MIEQKQEIAQSAISYASGGSLVGFASLAEVEAGIQLYALAVGALVITLRAIHDGVVLWRKLKEKDD